MNLGELEFYGVDYQGLEYLSALGAQYKIAERTNQRLKEKLNGAKVVVLQEGGAGRLVCIDRDKPVDELNDLIAQANRINKKLKDEYADQVVVDKYDSEGLMECNAPLKECTVDQFRRCDSKEQLIEDIANDESGSWALGYYVKRARKIRDKGGE